jgi:ATP-dependent RNA helicase DeaD
MTSRFANRGFSVVALSGELSQNERTHALQSLRDGRARVCIATDVAARGLDLPNLELVIHADLPRNRESLLHRSGRTGRAGRKGVCVLIVPYNARRSTERLLRSANVTAAWANPPSIDEIIRRDNQRILEEPALTEPVRDDERAFAQEILARHGAEQVAAAFLRSYRASRSAPEELLDNAPPERKERRRDDFKNGVWFTLSVGEKHRAEARWLMPMLCRAGGLTKRDIGAIKVRATETHVELAPDCVERFLDAVGPGGMIEKTIAVTRLKDAPTERHDARPPAARPAARKPDARADSKPKRAFEKKPDAPARDERAPERAAPRKPHTIKLADKSSRKFAKPGAKTRAAALSGHGPLRRKKPKKKSVTIVARRGKADPARE